MLWNFYSIRAQNDDVFCNLLPSNTRDVIDLGVSIVLPVKDKHGRRIIYDRPGTSPSQYNYLTLLFFNVKIPANPIKCQRSS